MNQPRDLLDLKLIVQVSRISPCWKNIRRLVDSLLMNSLICIFAIFANFADVYIGKFIIFWFAIVLDIFNETFYFGMSCHKEFVGVVMAN